VVSSALLEPPHEKKAVVIGNSAMSAKKRLHMNIMVIKRFTEVVERD
jgi:hypothetical protein